MQSFYRNQGKTVLANHDEFMDRDFPNTESYLRMSENEKNIEAVKASIRLQNIMLYEIFFHGTEGIQ